MLSKMFQNFQPLSDKMVVSLKVLDLQELIDTTAQVHLTQMIHCPHSGRNEYHSRDHFLVGKPPKDLMLIFNRIFKNPITHITTKHNREIIFDGSNIKIGFIQQPDQPMDTNNLLDAVRTPFEYKVNGVANHRGDARGGHYTTSFRDDNQWLEVDKGRLKAHNDTQLLTNNLVIMWASLLDDDDDSPPL